MSSSNSLVCTELLRFLLLCSSVWVHISERVKKPFLFRYLTGDWQDFGSFSFTVRVSLVKFQPVLILFCPFCFLSPLLSSTPLPPALSAALSIQLHFLPLPFSHWRIPRLKSQLDDDLCLSWRVSKCSFQFKPGNMNLLFENWVKASVLQNKDKLQGLWVEGGT